MTFYLFLSFLFLVAIFSSPVAALQNLTISWQNSSIVYQQNSSVWSSAPSSLDYSQSHTYTTTKGASASFQFTGVAIYYEAASWPYPVSVNISLDGDSGTFVDLRDYLSPQTPTTGSASVSASTHWYRTGLNNTSHTIVISIPDNATTAVVDALIYSVDTGDSQTGSTIWPIIVGGALGGLVLIGAIVAFIFLYRRRQKKKQEGALWDAPVLENLMTPLISHPAEAFPLVSAESNIVHSTVPPSSSRQPTMDAYGNYHLEYSRGPQSGFVEGSSSGSSRLASVTESSAGSSAAIAGRVRDDKMQRKADMAHREANPEPEELPPPAYTENHD